VEKVLVVNDCRLEEIILKDLLEDMNYTVRVEDEESAINGVNEFSPDIVIINLVMRKSKGNEVIKEIKKMNPSTRCILSSSNLIELKDYKEYGVDEVLHTPINQDKLTEVLRDKERLNVIRCPYCGKNI